MRISTPIGLYAFPKKKKQSFNICGIVNPLFYLEIIDWQTLINATSNGFSKSVFDLATSSTDILRMCLNNSCIPSTIPELEKELVAAVNIGLTPNVYETWYAKRFGFQQSTIFNNTNTTNAVPHATGTETIPNYLAGSSQSTSECLTAKANSFINQLNVNYHYQQTNDINQNELENYRIQNIPGGCLLMLFLHHCKYKRTLNMLILMRDI